MPLEVTFTGQAALEARLNALATGLLQQAAAALSQEAEAIMTEAKERTPVETGALRASGHVVPPVLEGGEATIVLAFGGDGAVNEHGVPVDSYAVVVHEDLEAHHPVGEAKFLERPLLEHAPGLPEAVAARMRAASGT